MFHHRVGRALLGTAMMLALMAGPASANIGPVILVEQKCIDASRSGPTDPWQYIAKVKATIKANGDPTKTDTNIASYVLSVRQPPTAFQDYVISTGHNTAELILNRSDDVTGFVSAKPPPAGTASPIELKIKAVDKAGRTTEIDPPAPPCLASSVPTMGVPLLAGLTILMLLIGARRARVGASAPVG